MPGKVGVGLLYLHGAYGLVSAAILAVAPFAIVSGGNQMPEGTTWEELRAEEPWLEPFLGQFLRLWGVSWFGMALLGLAVTTWPFRRGEPWAWWALWTYPLLQAYQAIDFLRSNSQEEAAFGLGFHLAMAALGFVALGLTWPVFFGRKSRAPAAVT